MKSRSREPSSAFLYVESGPRAGQSIPLRKTPFVVGRASVSDLRLQHPSVSRRHLQIRRVGEEFFVRDLGSQNGTYLNKRRVLTEIQVAPGDEIALGNAVLTLRMGKDNDRTAMADVNRVAALAQSPTTAPNLEDEAPEKSKTFTTLKTTQVALISLSVAFGVIGLLVMIFVIRGNLTRSTNQAKKSAAANSTAGANGQDPAAKAARDRQIEEAIVKQAQDAPAQTAPEKALSAYRSGTLEAALDHAKAGKEDQLHALMQQFSREFTNANVAAASGNVQEALSAYERAARLDQAISQGKGFYAGEVKQRIAALKAQSPTQAAPLPVIRPPSRPSRPPVKAPPPRPAPAKKKPAKSAIDDAFDE